jgi:hypothetical protein
MYSQEPCGIFCKHGKARGILPSMPGLPALLGGLDFIHVTEL